MKNGSFEYFASLKSSDILHKALVLDEYLQTGEDVLTPSLGHQISAATSPETTVCKNGEANDVIMLGSNSYLSLNSHPKVIEAAKNAINQFGYGMGAVSLYGGITTLHRELEERIATFYGQQDAIVFPSGYGTNVGVISALCGENDIIINDAANHASIFDASQLSGAEIKIYPHNNMKRLRQILTKLKDDSRGKLIITDGVFSMHGDLGPLDEIVQLAEEFNCRVMVDDAHGLGIVGKSGRGTAEFYNVMDKIDLNVGMLSKAPGGLGGYCAGSKELIQFLRLYSRTYFFSTALPAPTVAGLIEVFKLLENDEAGREKLWENINYLKAELTDAGFNIAESNSGVIPLVVGDEKLLGLFHQKLIKSGVYTNIVTYPAVRRKEARLRICMMNSLSKEQLARAIKTFIKIGAEVGLLKEVGNV
jgi:glycine C-acetyltransferase